MREVKYRLWCKERQEMIDIRKMYFEDGKLTTISCVDHDSDFEYFTEDNDHVLMQYTGLKDKNGREIYEKDIVEIKHTYDYMAFDGYERSWTITKGEVVFNYAGFDVKYLDRDGEPVWSGITLMECLSDMVSEWEVIGNIYENPELLEGK